LSPERVEELQSFQKEAEGVLKEKSR
jgi:hypothetical protein